MIGIDPLGILAGSASLGSVPVTDDELHVLIGLAGVPEVPVVLAHRHHHDSDTEREIALARAADALTARGLVRAGVVHPAMVDRLRTLGRPAWEIAVRRFGDGVTGPVGGPVTVFDTTAGRIVGTSSVAPDGTPWTTLSSGTDGFLRQALDDLVARLERDRTDR